MTGMTSQFQELKTKISGEKHFSILSFWVSKAFIGYSPHLTKIVEAVKTATAGKCTASQKFENRHYKFESIIAISRSTILHRQHRTPHLSTMAVQDLQQLLGYIHAQNIYKAFNSLVKECCVGCQYDHPSQKQHFMPSLWRGFHGTWSIWHRVRTCRQVWFEITVHRGS